MLLVGLSGSLGSGKSTVGRALAARGAAVLPDAPLDYPPWLQDLRSHWAGSE